MQVLEVIKHRHDFVVGNNIYTRTQFKDGRVVWQEVLKVTSGRAVSLEGEYKKVLETAAATMIDFSVYDLKQEEDTLKQLQQGTPTIVPAAAQKFDPGVRPPDTTSIHVYCYDVSGTTPSQFGFFGVGTWSESKSAFCNITQDGAPLISVDRVAWYVIIDQRA